MESVYSLFEAKFNLCIHVDIADYKYRIGNYISAYSRYKYFTLMMTNALFYSIYYEIGKSKVRFVKFSTGHNYQNWVDNFAKFIATKLYWYIIKSVYY